MSASPGRPQSTARAARALAAAVHRFVRGVPRGRVTTYGAVAARIGHPRLARAVGRALRTCPEDVPWHRVLNAQGGISPRVRRSGMLTQRIRLEHEGVPFRRGRVSLREYGWPSAAGKGIATCGWR